MKKVIYIDLDDTIFDLKSRYIFMKDFEPHIEYPQSKVGFFKNLSPLHGAVEAVKALEESGKYEVWFATAPSLKNLHCYSEKAEAILKHFGEDMQARLIIIPDKSKLIGDYLIDDNALGKGQENFQGELIHFKSERFPGWKSVLEYLLI